MPVCQNILGLASFGALKKVAEFLNTSEFISILFCKSLYNKHNNFIQI